MANKIASLDKTTVKAEKLRYALTAKTDNKVDHVKVPDTLISAAKQVMQEKTDYSFPITNQTLVKYALLNLLEPAVQKQVRHRLQDYHACSSLTKLLATNEDPRLTKTSQLTNNLLDVQEQLNRHDILLEAIVSSVAWLILERNGLDKLPLANDGDDIFTKLRQSDLKPIIDAILSAGIDEADRQRHLDNI